MKKPIIEIVNLTKRFKKKVVLNNINLEVYKGEIFGLLGPNGAGKTVLIQTLLGIILPDEGEIKILGKELQKNLDWIHNKVNLVAAYPSLQEQVTVFENLLTFAGLYGVRNAEKKIQKLLDFFGLEQYLNSDIQVGKLSSGENTRLLLCKALINDPEILFLDEPASSLDPPTSNKVLDLIVELCQHKGTTVFLASHNLIDIKRICTRLGFLKEGKIFPVKNLKEVEFLY